MKRERQDTQGMTMGHKTLPDIEPERDGQKKKLDLSAAQVAGSSLATVAAALLASQMGVYGTILGAGVVSVVATAGGPVIQHFFRRTGDQLRETARPKARQVPAAEPREERAPDGTMTLRAVPAGGPPDEEFGEGTLHGTRMRGWKRTAVASGAAFFIALGGLGTYEAVAGTSVSAGGGTILTGGVGKSRDHKPDPPKDEKTDPGAGTGEKGGKSPDTGNSPSPSHPTGGRSPEPDPDTSPSPDPAPTPTPTPDPPKPDPTPTPKPAPTPAPSTGKATPGGGTGTDTGTGQDPQTP